MDAILFDFDGTLIDGTEAIVESFVNTFNDFHLQAPQSKSITSLIGYPLEIMFEHLQAPKNSIEEFIQTYKKHYIKIFLKKTTLLPHAKQSVEIASKLAPLGIVTTKTSSRTREMLDFFNMSAYFQVVIGKDDVSHPKPHQEPILKALSIMKIKPSKQSYMIGDTCLDIKAAKNANISSIGLLCGYGTKEDLENCSKIIKNDSLEAVQYLQNLYTSTK